MEKKRQKNNLWFKAKYYGWGWYPCTWQGVLATLIAIFIFIFAWINIMQAEQIWINSLIIILDFIALLIICYKKGEKPRWRWGK
ncbi:MAG: hypothetical protein WCX73_03725 [Candidatus Pacearchaeota archaeon]|jgi:hypothetical protein